MSYIKETEDGNITIEKAVIGEIITRVISQFGNKVVIGNYKSKALNFASKMSMNHELNNMDISIGDRGLDIKVYIMVKFGTSIGMITNTIIEEIHEKIIKFVGVEPNSVAVVVTGTVSKNIAKRNIEIKNKNTVE